MKEIQVNEEIKAEIKRANGGQDINYGDIAVFETKALNTRPLRRKSGIFAAAVVDPEMLNEMASTLNASNEGVPFHLMHNREALNVGKVFRATVVTEADGAKVLHSQFYVPRSETQLVGRLNTGAVDQVSVGMQAKELRCSKCDYDYRAGSMQHLYSETCPKKHTIGQDGVHLKLTGGLESWAELSAVDTGAAADARIVSGNNSAFVPQETVYRLAANQNDLKTSIPLIANLDELISEETPQVDEAKIKEIMSATLSEHEKAHTEALAALQAQLDAEKTARTEAETKLASAIASDDKAKVTALETELAAAKEELDAGSQFLKDQAKKAQVASGVATPVEPADLKAAIAIITESKKNLVNLFDRDENSRSVDTVAKPNKSTFASFGAYQPKGDK